ncbi:MAG: glutamine synthetase beta-grasp domain-containing protein, partial [Nitrosotalea sp.]
MPYKVIGGEPVPVSYTSEDVFSKIKHDQIKFIDLQFTGLRGRFHHTTISSNLFTPQQMQDGLPKLDGSSIVGFASIEDSDMVLKPDPSTFALIPWMENAKTARLICDVYKSRNKGRLESDPRSIAEKTEKYLQTQGFDNSYWGPEVEFFVFDKINWDVLT